jgi:putative oxidoreductase
MAQTRTTSEYCLQSHKTRSAQFWRERRRIDMKIYKLGRAMFGGYFIYAGIHHFLKTNEIAQYAAAKNVPQPDKAVIATGIALVAGGASLALGLKPKWGAASVIGFLAAVSPMIHNFWSEEDPAKRMRDAVDFGKNMALLSGALALSDAEGK